MAIRLNDLRESNEFLNELVDHINCAIFLVDEDFKIRQFNRALQTIFEKQVDEITGFLCGEALGCKFPILENTPCGKTSNCTRCELRKSITETLAEKSPHIKKTMAREFYIGGVPSQKHLEFTTKFLRYRRREMILVIVDDVTESETQKQELLRKQQLIDQDLEAAAGIQQSLLPKRKPRFGALDVSWEFLPCQRVGGDIFNVFELEEGVLGCYMLDVSGHGVQSALVTVSASQALHPSSTLFDLRSPAALCEALDREYPFERFNTFFTMVYMVLDLNSGALTYTNAGHPPAVLLRADGSIEQLKQGGSIIGLNGMLAFEEGRRELRPGDRLLLFTDGLIERRNRGGEMFRLDRLFTHLKETRKMPLDKVLSQLLAAAMDFGGDRALEDDISMLGIEFRGGGG